MYTLKLDWDDETIKDVAAGIRMLSQDIRKWLMAGNKDTTSIGADQAFDRLVRLANAERDITSYVDARETAKQIVAEQSG